MLLTLLAGCVFISCNKEEVDTSRAEQLVGIWELDDMMLSVNANEPYLESILAEKILNGRGMLRPYIFEDTIQFHEMGYFLESHQLVQEGDLPSEFSGTYSVNGREITFSQPRLSAVWYDRTPLFDCEDDLLVFYITLPESSLEEIRLHLQSDGHDVDNLEIEKINYTQIYRKMKSFPYGQE